MRLLLSLLFLPCLIATAPEPTPQFTADLGPTVTVPLHLQRLV